MELPFSDHYFLLGPLLALLVVGLLAGLLRWTYGTHHQHVAPSAEGQVDDDEDLGLLREVTVVPSAEAAGVLRVLAAGGIRGTVRLTRDDVGRRILVFAEDEAAAKMVLSRLD